MKKSLMAVGLLFLLSAGGLLAANLTVGRSAKAVELTETVLAGDPAAAADLTVVSKEVFRNRLFWEITMHPGGGAEPRCYFDPKPKTETSHESRVELGLETNMSGTGVFYFDESSSWPSTNEILKDVATRVRPGSTHHEVAEFSDYYSTYHLACSIWMDHGVGWSWKEKTEKSLADYFQFPVLSGHKLDVVMEADPSGAIVSVTTNSVGGEQIVDSETAAELMVRSASAGDENTAFFTVEARQVDGTLMDYSRVPGGYGVYRLSFRELGTGEIPVPTPVLPLAPEESVLQMELSADGERVLLVVESGGEYSLITLSMEGKLLQRLPVELPGSLRPEESFVLLYVWETEAQEGVPFQVFEEQEDGTLTFLFSGREPSLGEKQHISERAFAFDGRRLAIAGRGEGYGVEEDNLYWLSVHDESGLLYHGKYEHSINRAFRPDNRWRDWVHASGFPAIFWENT